MSSPPRTPTLGQTSAAARAGRAVARMTARGTTLGGGHSREISEDYFSTGVWASLGPLRLRQFSCVMCGNRSTTLALFRLHRLVCRDREVWERSD